jgi:hypothetical protein
MGAQRSLAHPADGGAAKTDDTKTNISSNHKLPSPRNPERLSISRKDELLDD